MNTLETLVAARALIEKPENWTTQYMARAKNGRPIGAVSEKAIKFCMAGAIDRVTNGCLEIDDWDVIRTALIGADINFADFNDAPERTHAEILATFDRAIETQRTTIKTAE